MRKSMVAITAVALVAGTAWAVKAAETGDGRTPLKCMDSVWRTSELSTSSTTFAVVPGFRETPSAIFPIAIDVSAVVSGAPVEFRVMSTNVGGQTHASRPGVASFVPSGGDPDSFSFRWIERNQAAAEHVNLLRLQWRSPSGGAVHLLRGDMSVEYTTDGCPGSS